MFTPGLLEVLSDIGPGIDGECVYLSSNVRAKAVHYSRLSGESAL